MTPVVHLSRCISALPEAVFDAWLSPKSMAVFLCPGPGVKAAEIEVDPRPDGAFSLVMLAGDVRIPIRGAYRVIDRPHRLEFSWHSHRTTRDSVVSLTFRRDGFDTVMTLEHRGFVDEVAREDHAGGWEHILTCLALDLAG